MKRYLSNVFGLGKTKLRKSRRARPVRLTLNALEQRVTPASLHADFNGDGFDDLAIGMPTANYGPNADNGAVQVLYGSAAGLNAASAQFLRHSSKEADLLFGLALAAGDFNADGFDDLAVGSPGKDLAQNQPDTGSVTVFFGSATGLKTSGRQEFDEYTGGVPGTPEAGNLFGYALAAGDFNGDGHDDLAIGVPNDGLDVTGGVNVLFGAAAGLTTDGAVKLVQGLNGVLDGAEFGDGFGSALAAGDFNGDGRDDLAIGAPYQGITYIEIIDRTRFVNVLDNVGAVNIVFGAARGFATSGNQFWMQNSQGANGNGGAEAEDHFGFALAAGDFDGNGRDDLAIGVPDEDLDGFTDAGAVHLLFGSVTGLMATGSQFLTQNTAGVAGSPRNGDQFGFALAAGDFNGDGRDDFAIGAPGDEGVGTVTMVFGLDLVGFAFDLLTENNDGSAPSGAAGDQFGFALSAGDYNGDGRDDLTIGIPGKDVQGLRNLGQVETVYFGADGLHDIDFTQMWDVTNLGQTWFSANPGNTGFGKSL